jgi:hypothetical protein
MSGIWLISYLALWAFVLLQSLLLLALLRHIGNLRLWLKQAGIIGDVVRMEDGPEIGTNLGRLSEVLTTETESSINLSDPKAKMLVFVPAGFFGCDNLIPALREFENLQGEFLRLIIVSIEPSVAKQFDVARQHGIKAPILTDHGWQIAEVCSVTTEPYALMLDQGNMVRSKQPVSDLKDLEKLFQTYRKSLDGAIL